jgi:hypothetical protein
MIEQPMEPDPRPPGQRDTIPGTHPPDPVEEPPADPKPVPPPDIPPPTEPTIPESL